MAKLNSYLNNAICQLFDEIEDKCKVKFAKFTASDLQGQETIAAGQRDYMDDTPNNESHGIYKYLYDPQLTFDFRFHQRLAAMPFKKTNKPWATIMFSTKQVRPLTNMLSHKYKKILYNEGVPYEFLTRRVSVPVNMAIISNDMTKLYNTTEKMAMYFDRFINFHYNQVISMGDDFTVQQNVSGQAMNIREVDLTKYDTTTRGSIVAVPFTFDLIYWVVDTPGTELKVLKKIILEIKVDNGAYHETIIIQDDEESENKE